MPEFETASRDRFFLLILAHDPSFTTEGAKELLGELDPITLSEVPN